MSIRRIAGHDLVPAGIHNAEYVGIQAAIELSSEIDPEQLGGTLVIVPVANRSGFENRTMSMVHEDGKNLNRVFPGDESGTSADRCPCFHAKRSMLTNQMSSI